MDTKLLLTLLGICVVAAQANASWVVNTTNGLYRGELRGTYFAFEGIRYAEPPEGELRFKPPQPYTRRHLDVVNATQPGLACMQLLRSGSIDGAEDCLFLNIYTPSQLPARELPVIVFIHGGGFIFGKGDSYRPSRLLTRNLIYVNLNYRLGPLGFLSSGNSDVTGNMGMKDQVMALRWIKENILNFGGDPNRITITGWSAGGASVQMHFMSPLSDGLFASGISHGGSALNPWVMQLDPARKFSRVVELTRCRRTTIDEEVRCLRRVSAKSIVAATAALMSFWGNPFNPFGVVVESSGSAEPFLTATPLELLQRGEVKRLPWIVSGVRDEGYYPAAELLVDNRTLTEVDENFADYMKLILHVQPDSNVKAFEKIREHYLGERPINEETFGRFVKIITDYLYVVGLHTSAQLHGPLMPTWVYAFDYKTLYAYGELMAGREVVDGISHGEDISLIYENDFRSIPFTPEENQMISMLLDMYESFASIGVPVVRGVDFHRTLTDDKINFVHIKGPGEWVTKLNYDFDPISEKPFWAEIEKILASSGAVQKNKSAIFLAFVFMVGFFYLTNTAGSS